MVTLPPTITPGVLNLAGTTPDSQQVAERLLAMDRETHHCFYGKVGFHNHLSHHILAAYDFGASASLLQKIYDKEANPLRPLHLENRNENTVQKQSANITPENWRNFLQQEKYYASYLDFFTKQVAENGVGNTIETYVFSPEANGNEGKMAMRLVGGALHPIIQLGYGVEFGSEAMVAQALAQAAVHSDFYPEIFDFDPPQVEAPRSLLSIMREVYDSAAMEPVLPYDPDALLSARFQSAFADGTRTREIRRVSTLWGVPSHPTSADIDLKLQELFFVAALLLAGTGKRGREPRLDFFLMHVLNAALFLPSVLPALTRVESRAMLLRAFLPVTLAYLTIRGRPRIDCELLMSYTRTPHPPSAPLTSEPSEDAIGDPREANPWPAIVGSVVHAPDAHTVKAVRGLYYAARRWGSTPAGAVPGAFDAEGKETLLGIGKVDGTVFVRAAGVVMDTLGWVTHGQKAGSWDGSGLGWDDAWKE